MAFCENEVFQAILNNKKDLLMPGAVGKNYLLQLS
jgi:hypothetical protein